MLREVLLTSTIRGIYMYTGKENLPPNLWRTNGLKSPATFRMKKTLEMVIEPQIRYYFSTRTSFCCSVGSVHIGKK